MGFFTSVFLTRFVEVFRRLMRKCEIGKSNNWSAAQECGSQWMAQQKMEAEKKGW